jgi:hypothetical protein
VRVTDNGSPVLYDEETITVTVTAAALNMSTVETTASAAKQKDGTVVQAKTTLYPNPVASRFTISLKAPAQQALITIFDVKGAVVYTKKQAVRGQQFQVEAAALKPGQYLVQLQTAQGTDVLKFVKL